MDWEEQHPNSQPDPTRAWEALSVRLHTTASEQPKPIVQEPIRRLGFRPFFWWAAASLVMVIGGGWLLRNQLLYTTYQTAYGQVARLQLPDGSHTNLNANSQLRLFRPWLGRLLGLDREVWLQGEANFSIVHTADDKRFVVHTNRSLDVEVLGTEFLVTTRPDRLRVALHSGKVLLRSTTVQGHTKLAMKPGDVFTHAEKRGDLLQHRQPTQALTTWQTHEFTFDHASLPDVLTTLEEEFGVRVTLAHDSLATAQITGRLRAERADELLSAITELTGYRLVVQNGQTVLMP